MPVYIKSNAELQRELNSVMNEVFEEVAKEMLDKLVKRINDEVYGEQPTPLQWYERTHQFRDAWQWTPTIKKMSQVLKTLYFERKDVKHNKDNWQHGNKYQSAVGTIEDILNVAFRGYTAGTTADDKPWKHSKPYWDNFIKEMFDDGWLDDNFRKKFKDKGLNVK